MSDELNKKGRYCRLCGRQVSLISLHHLVPKEMGGEHSETIALCQPCHSTIHLHFSNKELAKDFNTVPKLQQANRLSKYLNWIRKRKVEKISNQRSR